MKRINSLIAAIFSVVVAAYQIFANAYTLIAFIAVILNLGDGIDSTSLIIFVWSLLLILAVLILCIVSLIFACKTFFAYQANHEIFEKRKKNIVTTIVLNFILVLLFMISCISTDSAGGIIIYFISLAVLVAANVLYIIDIQKEKSKVESQNVQENTSAEQIPVQNVNDEKKLKNEIENNKNQ